jgi:hypothetical protein
MVDFCDVAILLFELLQYIMFDVAAHNVRRCSTYFLMLQYMFFSMLHYIFFVMLQYIFFDVAVHVFFRCCTAYFCNVAVHDFDVAVHVFRCCTI